MAKPFIGDESQSTGSGSGYGDGSGSGSGSGDGSGDGYGDGSGSSYGYGDGYGDGYGYGELNVPKEAAWLAWHYIRRNRGGVCVMRDGKEARPLKHIHRASIEMCKRGLHASLTPQEACRYKPNDSVLTKVKIWGRVIVGRDKLVATDRMIIEACE